MRIAAKIKRKMKKRIKNKSGPPLEGIQKKPGKHVVLGICGSIGAYKVPELIRKIRRLGAEVTCILTDSGARFVSALTLQTLSGNKVYEGMFDYGEFDVKHISLAKKSDVIVVVPATADVIARFANGRAQDLLSSVVLSTKAPVLICPAMNSNMWQHLATKKNVKILKEFGYQFVGPDKGDLACGDEGIGRLADLDKIVESIQNIIV